MTIRIHDTSDKTYVVLGAPGSATSFISKALERLRVNMGNAKNTNKQIFYQNPDFEELNRNILSEAGGGAASPPSQKKIMAIDADDRIKALINKYKGKFWGWKDPQTSLTIKKYLPHLDGDVYLICTFRKPKHLLGKYRWYRNRAREENKKLADAYNKAIISAIKEFCEL